jgi:integrase
MTSPNSHPSHTILDGKVHVFMRDGSPYWWSGFHFKGKYIRTSTKQKSLDAAKAIAQQWYFQKQNEIANGEISSSKHAFGKLAVAALANYKMMLVDRGIRSQKTYDGIEGIMNSRVKDYFNKTPVQAIDNTAWHKYKEDMIAKYPTIKRGTLHQYKNAIRVVLNYAYKIGYLKQLPVFKDEYTTNKHINSRPWFNSAEYSKLHSNILAHAKRLEKKDKRQFANAMELYDFVIFGVSTGMRIGELRNCKVSDVKIEVEKLTGKEILIISNIDGKRGKGMCQSFYGAVKPYRAILERRNIKDPAKCDEKLFLIHHRVMFNEILKKTNLKETNTKPPMKRDFVSLRSTYICFRLLNGVPIYEIANNCRTSVAVIQEHYAKPLGGVLMKNINKTNIEGWDY